MKNVTVAHGEVKIFIGLNMGDRVDVSNLFVASFSTKYLSEEVIQWSKENTIPYAESCVRQVLYGRASNFKNFPLSSDTPSLKTYSGADAYLSLLTLISGFESKRLGETHIRKQFHDCWATFRSDYMDEAINYERLVGHLNEDINFVRNHIASQFRKQRHELVARDISGQEKGDNIVIIGHMSNGGGSASYTEGLIRVSENRQVPNKKRPMRDFITFTHPDEAILTGLKRNIVAHTSQGNLRSNIKFIPFSELSSALEENERVYIDIPMNLYKDADMQIIQMWQGRVNHNNSLTHMRGDPENRALSSDEWKNAGLDNYTSPEDIMNEMSNRGRNNKIVIAKSFQALEMCANIRLEGQKPSNKIVDDGHCLHYEI